MYAFNSADGSVRWTKTAGPGIIMSSPVLKNGIIYTGAADGKIYAFKSTNGDQVWVNGDAGSNMNLYSGPVVSEKAVYSGTLDGKVTAMDPQTGVTKWIATVAGARFQAAPCVITYAGTVYYPGLSGDIQ